MSRIGRQPITVLAGVTISVTDGLVTVKGPKGELQQALHRDVMATVSDGHVLVTVKNPEQKDQKALWGLFRRLIDNMVIGVTTGFSKQLEINGIGFKAVVKGSALVLEVGFSHSVEYKIPAGVEIKVEKNIITISGADKSLVGQTAAQIRSIKEPEPYKGKGIRYTDEVVRRKEGKAAAKAQ